MPLLAANPVCESSSCPAVEMFHQAGPAGWGGPRQECCRKPDAGGCRRVTSLCCDFVLAGCSVRDLQMNVLTILALDCFSLPIFLDSL